MKRRKALILAAVCAGLLAAPVTALAADRIDEVYISLVPGDDLNEMAPGETRSGDAPSTPASADYWVNNYYFSSGSTSTPGRSYTYTMEVECDRGLEFGRETEVTVYGAYELTVSFSSARRMTIRAKTYPFHKLGTVKNIKIDTAAKKATWDKVDYAKDYEVRIYYTQNDRERVVNRTVSSASIGLGGYIGKNSAVNDVLVRAVPGSSTSDRYMASEGLDDGDPYDFRPPTATRLGSRDPVDKNPPSAGSGGPGPAGGKGSAFNGWQGGGNVWYYLSDGVPAVGWKEVSRDEWYLFGSSGVMLTGWQFVGGRYYYLNEQHDGFYGRMLTGYRDINGRRYYLNEQHDGTYGAMYASRYTPDGSYAGADGSIAASVPPGASSGNYVTDTPGPGSSGSSGPGGPGAAGSFGMSYTGWQGGGDEWYYIVNGVRATGWREVAKDEWYLFNSSGRMLTGWQYVDGLYYFMNTNHDGSYGKMLAGYRTINGRLYYFNELHDGYYGAMYASRYTPDGRYAGADGAIY